MLQQPSLENTDSSASTSFCELETQPALSDARLSYDANYASLILQCAREFSL